MMSKCGNLRCNKEGEGYIPIHLYINKEGTRDREGSRESGDREWKRMDIEREGH